MAFLRRHVRKAVLVLALLLGTAWFLPSFFSAERYRRQLEAGLQQTLHRPVRFGAASFRLLPHPGFSIENAVISEDAAFGPEPFARVERMDCDLRWRSLWHSRLQCSALHLDHPTLNAVRNARGDWNVDTFLAASGNASTATALPVSAPANNLDVDADSARINFKIGDNKKPFAITELRARLRFDAGQSLLRYQLTGSPVRTDLSLPSPGPLELEGEWRPGRGPAEPLSATLRARKSLLYDWAPLIGGQNPEIYGVVDADVRLTGSLRVLKMEGDAQIDQLHRWGLPPPSDSMPVAVHFRAELDRNHARASLDALEVAFAGSHLHLLGSGEWTQGVPTLDLVAALEKSRVEDLEELSHRLWGYSFNRFRASGRIDGLVTIQGPWGRFRYSGFLRAANASLITPAGKLSVPPLAVQVDDSGARLAPVKLTLAPRLEVVMEGRLARGAAAAARDRSPGLGVRGSGFGVRDSRRKTSAQRFSASPEPRAPSPSLFLRTPKPETRNPKPADVQYELQLSTRAAPISGLLALARDLGVKAAQGVETQGVASATLRLTGSAWPLQPPTLEGTGSVRDARLLIPGFNKPLDVARADAHFGGDRVVVSPLMAAIGSSTFTGTLEHQGKLSEPWKFKMEANNLNLQEAFSWFADLRSSSPLSFLESLPGLGSLARDREEASHLFGALNAQGVFTVPSLTYRSVTLKDFRASVQVIDRVIRVTDAQFQAGGGRGQGRLKVDISSGPPRLAADFSLAKGSLPAVAGRLPAQLHKIRGSWTGSGHFETSGATHEDLSANLRGDARLELKSVALGDFDPLDAIARAAGWGMLQPSHREAGIRAVALTLVVRGLQARLSPVNLSFEGAHVAVGGECGLDGSINLGVRADFSHLGRHWLEIDSDERLASLRLTGLLPKPVAVLGTEESRARPSD
ncbi:MAG TPA: AsmA family protein [Terriglobia bacterium]|nr:AsmA family protein [Terriglobia bacterium]